MGRQKARPHRPTRMTANESGQPDCLSPKACLKQAFTNGWIGNEETWLKMLDARNRMSQTYRAKDALKVFESLRSFLPEFNRLLDDLRMSDT